jgi:NAD(P)-dependent dehydrogenase (short-subunit alcohol dehydrogenase family)
MSQAAQPPFAGKTVLVTGASSGIGRASALLLASQGAHVIVSARREDRARQTVAAIREAGGAADFIAVDIASEASIDALFAEIETMGPLHGALNNAGTEGEHSPLPDMPVEEFDRVMNTNVRGTWLCLRHEASLMRAQGYGSIVNVSSIAGVVGFAQ